MEPWISDLLLHRGITRSVGFPPLPHPMIVSTIFTLASVLMALPMVECRRRPFEVSAGRQRLSWPRKAIIILIMIGVGAELLEGAIRIWAIVYFRDTFNASLLLQSLVLPAFTSASANRSTSRGQANRSAWTSLDRKCFSCHRCSRPCRNSLCPQCICWRCGICDRGFGDRCRLPADGVSGRSIGGGILSQECSCGNARRSNHCPGDACRNWAYR